MCVPIPAGTIPHTLCYALVGDDGVHLIDPGWGVSASAAALERALTAIDQPIERVRSVIATHFHPDHMGGVAGLRARTGARTAFSAVEAAILTREAAAQGATYDRTLAAWGVPPGLHEDLGAAFRRAVTVAPAAPDVALGDGDTLRLGAHRLRVLVTPGHTGGHLTLVDEDREIIYTGDNVLPRIYPGVGIGVLPGGDPLGDYFASLERLTEFGTFTVLPGHEFTFTGLAIRCEEIIEHHLRRTAEVAALAADLGEAPTWEYARRLSWSAGWERMTGLWLHSALLQTSLHREYLASGRATSRLGARAARQYPGHNQGGD